MRLRLAVVAVALALGSCSTAPEDTTPPPASPPPSRPSTPAVPPPPDRTPRDACGASELQHLVGRPRTEIPIPVDPGRQRVACTTCPVTQDFRPDRLNFFFDARTGVIEQIRCG